MTVIGSTYTTINLELELQDNPDDRSRMLNQFNLEVTLALLSYSTTSLMVRLQHSSSILGALGGVWDASNFFTIGLCEAF